MKRIVIILWTGSVLCGACSIKRHTQRERTASERIDRVETHAGIRRDSSLTRRGRQVAINRHWEAVAPHTGWVYRYTENVRIAEAEQTVEGSSAQRAASVHHHEQHEATDHRQHNSRANGMGRWWLIPVVLAILWGVGRRIRFWPFK